MTVNEKIEKLRKLMNDKKIDFYIVPSADFHQSEYVGDYFKARAYITGFTGSAGTALITKDSAYLWTDGRYFLQAGIQLQNTHIQLMKMGEKDVPTLKEFIKNNIKQNENIGYDGRVIPISDGIEYENIVSEKNGKIIYDLDLVGDIWSDRPLISDKKAYYLEEKYTGEIAADKIAKIRGVMKDFACTHHIVPTLDDICWILNIRGDDVLYSPLILSYLMITKDDVYLYADENKFDEKIKQVLSKVNVKILPYNDIYEEVKKIKSISKVLLDKKAINYALYKNIPEDVEKYDNTAPSTILKSIKNDIEVQNQKKAQLMDAVAHVKFMKWLKENVDNIEITEISASEKLDEFRKENKSYVEPSFAPISAFGSNGAIIHYSADEKSNTQLKSGKLFMTDTGAGYFEGTTDITRTYALGEISDEMKEHFTVVAMSNLALANAKFLYGISCANLDVLARAPFWERGINYNHGTGHGVGYLLNVHEGPMSMRWQQSDMSLCKLEEGMIITDEPGIYIEGSHGIRLENELLVRDDYENEYGKFMKFEIMTHVPFDLDAINPSIMSDIDKKRLNDYHKKVYELVSPHLNEDEKKWLSHYTRAI